MRKVKTLLIIAVALAAVLLFTACGSKTTLNGIDVSKFTIVYPEYATDAEVRAAEYIRDAILEKTGIELPIVDDTTEETKHEIVIGNTERKITRTARRINREEIGYTIASDETSIALDGEFFLIAGAANYFVENYITGAEFKSEIPATLSLVPEQKDPTNFIMLIGDGMGEYQTRLYEYLSFPEDNEELLDYEDYQFFGYMFPHIGWSMTDCYSGTTDSAAGGTALATGYKTLKYVIGRDKYLNDVQSLTELANELGKKTAVMSTDSYTGATPASFSAHADDRGDEEGILATQEIIKQAGTILECELNDISVSELEERVYNMLQQLDEDEDGFFMMYEEAHIDKHCHDNEIDDTFFTLIRFNRVISVIMEYVMYNPDTFVVITADHETGGLKDVGGKLQYSKTSHSNADVPIFAYGKGSEYFDGETMLNIDIAKYFAQLMGKEDFGMQYSFTDPEGEGEPVESQD